jgi:rhodanese-related sulfurtransferase
MYPASMTHFQLPLEIDPAAFAASLEHSPATAPLLLDVRETWEFDLAHLPDSLSMPMGDVPSRAHIELDPDRPIITICHHGVRSLHVANWLRAQGFEHAQSLSGGIDAWSREIDPSMPRY